MSKRRAPWWMYVIAASFIAFTALLIYFEICGPEQIGIAWELSSGEVVVQWVVPNSAAARAGIREGDVVVAVDGRPIRSKSNWRAIEANPQVGRARHCEIERSGRRFTTSVTLQRQRLDVNKAAMLLARTAVRLITLALAVVIAFSRPYDLVACMGAWFLAAVASYAMPPPHGMNAAWRDFPVLFSAFLWIPLISQSVGGSLVFSFFAIFPRKLIHARWLWMLVWIPSLIASVGWLKFAYEFVYSPETTERPPAWLLLATAFIAFLSIIGGVIALIVNYRRLEDINERRRVRVLVPFFAGCSPANE